MSQKKSGRTRHTVKGNVSEIQRSENEVRKEPERNQNEKGLLKGLMKVFKK